MAYLRGSTPRRIEIARQSEAAECALACVAMIATAHGYRTDVLALRRRFPISQKGATLATVVAILRQLGFETRALRVAAANLTKVEGPAVLHWEGKHFVVLCQVRPRRQGTTYTIADPVVGEYELPEEEFSERYSGVALEVAPGLSFRRGDQQTTISVSHLWGRSVGLKRAALQVLLFTGIAQGLAILAPLYLKLGVDSALSARDAIALAQLGVGFLLVAILAGIFLRLRNLVIVNLGGLLGFQMTRNVVRHMLRLPLEWFEKRYMGDILAKAQMVEEVSTIITRNVLGALFDGVLAAAALVVMCIYSTALVGVAAGAVAIYGAVRLWLVDRNRLALHDTVAAHAREDSFLAETVRNISVFKAFSAEELRASMWERLKARASNAQIRSSSMNATIEAFETTWFAIENVVFVYVALYLAMFDQLSIGGVLAMVVYKQIFVRAATRSLQSVVEYQTLQVHLERIADITANAVGTAYVEMRGAEKPLRGKVELRGVSYSYGFNERCTVRDVTVLIQPGEVVAIQGASGAGKTTLLKLMAGLLHPTTGMVLIDDLPLGTGDAYAVRSQIGYVAQGEGLLAGTVAENIALFDEECDQAHIEQCARIANIHSELQMLPMGYSTLVGDMGCALSGGQVQRIVLARALYRRPRVLFIDEGTANLDVAGEKVVAEGLRELGITQILTAHRPDTLRRVPRVLTLLDGRLFEAAEGAKKDAHEPAIVMA